MERKETEYWDDSALGVGSSAGEVEDYSRRKPSTPALWTRCRRAFAAILSSFFPSRVKYNIEDAFPLLSSSEQWSELPQRRIGLTRVSRRLLFLLVGSFAMLCVLDPLPSSY